MELSQPVDLVSMLLYFTYVCIYTVGFDGIKITMAIELVRDATSLIVLAMTETRLVDSTLN